MLFFSDNQNLIHHPLSLICFILVTKETFPIWDINMRPCCLQLELCSSRDSKELWRLTCVSDVQWCISCSIYFLFRMHTHTHTLGLVGPGWCPVSLAYEAVASDGVHSSPDCHTLPGSHHYWLPLISLSLSLTLFSFFSFDFPLLSRNLLDLTLSFLHLSLYLTPTFLVFFLPPSLQSMQSLSSSLCSCPRCWSRCTVWASSPTSTPHSTASTVWWVHTHTHTNTHTVTEWKNKLCP